MNNKIILLTLWVLSILLFLLYNISGIFYSFDVTHPSETEAMYFSDRIIEHSNYENGLILNTTQPWYELSGFWVYNESEQSFYPRIAWWIIYLSVLSKIIWIPPITLISIINIIGVLYIFMLTTKLLDERRWILVASLFALAPYTILWNNFLYGNLLWISYFIIAIYYFTKSYQSINILVGILFLFLFFWIRFEAVVYIILFIVYIIWLHKSFLFQLKHLLKYITLTMLLFGWFLYSNYEIYNDPLHVWYADIESKSSVELSESEIISKNKIESESTINKLLYKYQFFRIRFIERRWWIKNASIFAFDKAYRFIIEPYWTFILLTFLWFFRFFGDKKISTTTKKFIYITSIIALYFTFFETFSFHYWWNRYWLTSFYPRYFFFVYFILIFISIYYLWQLKKIWLLILFLFILSSFDQLLIKYPDWLHRQVEKKATYQEMKTIISENDITPGNSVIVSTIFSKILYDFIIINPIEFYDIQINNMMGTINSKDIDICELAWALSVNYRNKNIVSVEQIPHNSYMRLWEKFWWTEIYKTKDHDIYILDIENTLNYCNSKQDLIIESKITQ